MRGCAVNIHPRITVSFQTHPLNTPLCVSFALSRELARECTEPQELSNDLTSLMLDPFYPDKNLLESVALTVERREATFKLRRDTADKIGKLIANELFEMFASRDVTNGYGKEYKR